MGSIARIAVICSLTVAWCAAVAEEPLAIFSISEKSIVQMRERLPLASAEVNDPIYKRKQRYQGLWLSDVLERFRPRNASGIGPIRDESAPQSEDWQPLPGSGTSSTPAPGYLVWVSASGDDEKYPWPYQMVAIELVSHPTPSRVPFLIVGGRVMSFSSSIA